MAVRIAYAPVLPELDPFLFASVGEEVEGIPLSVVSALARLDLDPRKEAARLSHLTSRAAASQLGRLLARLPDRPWTPLEIRRTARKLVELLPAAPKTGNNAQGTDANFNPLAPQNRMYLALALAGALAFGLLAHGHVTSDGHETVPAASPADLPISSAPMR
jgi:hypothetical protein